MLSSSSVGPCPSEPRTWYLSLLATGTGPPDECRFRAKLCLRVSSFVTNSGVGRGHAIKLEVYQIGYRFLKFLLSTCSERETLKTRDTLSLQMLGGLDLD
uniref:Uncharacterized protein n=1 Tax=Physcomitrium patens TaxID=3218 RepID=A0A2K1IE75_PHYPA|nr:hypothetical protein PHYPA_029733 [Physcomitrium patens]